MDLSEPLLVQGPRWTLPPASRRQRILSAVALSSEFSLRNFRPHVTGLHLFDGHDDLLAIGKLGRQEPPLLGELIAAALPFLPVIFGNQAGSVLSRRAVHGNDG